MHFILERFLLNEEKAKEIANDIDENTSEVTSEETSEENSQNTSEETKEKYDKHAKHAKHAKHTKHAKNDWNEKDNESYNREPECGYEQCQFFQESKVAEDIKSCANCAEWFQSKFDNEKNRHI